MGVSTVPRCRILAPEDHDLGTTAGVILDTRKGEVVMEIPSGVDRFDVGEAACETYLNGHYWSDDPRTSRFRVRQCSLCGKSQRERREWVVIGEGDDW